MHKTALFLFPVFLLFFNMGICADVPERILVLHTPDVSGVQKYLNSGWTVKHQSVAMSDMRSGSAETLIIVFTLTPPPDLTARLEQEQKEKAAAFQKRREEWLKEHQPEKAKSP